MSNSEYAQAIEQEALRWSAQEEARSRRRSWLQSKVVLEHAYEQVTGDASKNWVQWIDQTYLSTTGRERALSLGCNDAFFERQLLNAGICHELDGFDISPVAIETANAAAQRDGLSARFFVADANTITLSPDHYDLALSIMAMHHFADLDHVLSEIHQSLKPGGFFWLNEYVGASRFQWPRQQLQLATEVLQILPPERRQLVDGSIRERLAAPDLDEMMRSDPFEAVRSADIVPLVYKYFDVVARRDYGGSILHLLLHDIIHNFDDDNANDREVLRILCDVEELLLRRQLVPSDFTVIVARRKSDTSSPALNEPVREQIDISSDNSSMADASTGETSPDDRYARVLKQLQIRDAEVLQLQAHIRAIEKGKVMRAMNAFHHLFPRAGG